MYIPSLLQCLSAQFLPLSLPLREALLVLPRSHQAVAPIPIPGGKQLLSQKNQEFLCFFTVPDDSTGPTNLRV